MKNFEKKINPAVMVLLIFLSSCIQAERNNKFDPGSSSYIDPAVNTGNVNTNNTNAVTIDTKCTLFVSVNKGDDANSGEWNLPFKTITRAVAESVEGDIIGVTAGDYDISKEIIIDKGIVLLGGYPDEADFSWDDSERSAAANTTSITDTRSSGGTAVNPLSVLKITGSVDNDIVIDGFKIHGGSGAYLCGIFLDTDTIAGYTAVIKNNIINGGSAGSSVSGIGLINKSTDGSVFTFDIIGNIIIGGELNVASNPAANYGIQADSSGSGDTFNISVYNNIIDTGIVTTASACTSRSKGISMIYTSMKIFNNTIKGGSEITTADTHYNYGIFTGLDSAPFITNNIIFSASATTSYGIYENSVTSIPSSLKNNDIYNCDWLYRGGDSTVYNSVLGGDFYIDPVYLGVGVDNMTQSVTFAGDMNFHIAAGTSAVVFEGGKTLSDFTTDRDGNTRTVPWSIGAYEYDGE